MADEEKRSTQSVTYHGAEKAYGDSEQSYSKNVKSTRESDSKGRAPKLTLNYSAQKSTPVSIEASRPEADKRSRSEGNFDNGDHMTGKLVPMMNKLQAEMKQVKAQFGEKEKRDPGTDQIAHEYLSEIYTQASDISKLSRSKRSGLR